MALANQAVKLGMKTRLKNAVSRGTDKLPSNTDANRYLLTRPFKDNALGGQDVIQKRVLGARDQYRNPWKYDDARRTKVNQAQSEIDAYKTTLKDPNLDDVTKRSLNEEVTRLGKDISSHKARTGDDPGLWKTTKEMTGGVWSAMNTGSAAQVATKWGAVGAGYMALNGIGRGISGGGATYDSSGKRDIMGVPFV